MLETILTGIASFVGTNIDDIFIDMLFFAEADTKHKVRGVVLGKYLGIGALVLLSVIGAFGLQFLPEQYVRFLGLIPIALGIKELIEFLRNREDDDDDAPEQKATGLVWNVALVSIASGADNIGVYIPLFAGFAPWKLVTVVGVFLVMIAVWCLLGKKLADLPFLRRFLVKYKGIIVPVVFIALGVYILLG